MPNRIIREGINESERVDQLSAEAEVFYRRLMNAVDDQGLYYGKPELLIAKLFPLRTSRVTPVQIDGWLSECVQARLIRLYTVDGKRYLEYVDFRQQVRTTKSRFPLPADADQPISSCKASATQMHSNCEASAHLDVSVFESVSGAERGPKAADGEDYSPDFEAAWALYPQRHGGNPKRLAWKAWRARLRDGVPAAELSAAINRYAAFIRAAGKEGTEFVKQAATFLGPDGHYREPWEVAPRGMSSPSGASASYVGNVV